MLKVKSFVQSSMLKTEKSKPECIMLKPEKGGVLVHLDPTQFQPEKLSFVPICMRV